MPPAKPTRGGALLPTPAEGEGGIALLGAAGEVAGAPVCCPFSSRARPPACRATHSFATFDTRYPPAAGLCEYLYRGFGDGHRTGVTSG